MESKTPCIQASVLRLEEKSILDRSLSKTSNKLLFRVYPTTPTLPIERTVSLSKVSKQSDPYQLTNSLINQPTQPIAQTYLIAITHNSH